MKKYKGHLKMKTKQNIKSTL